MIFHSSYLLVYVILLAITCLSQQTPSSPPWTGTDTAMGNDRDAPKGLKIYCHMLAMGNSDCEAKFTGLQKGPGGSYVAGEHQVDSLVARKAAEACLAKAGLQTASVQKMFGVQMKDMSQYSEGGAVPKPACGIDCYSEEQKERAYDQAYRRKSLENQAIHKLEEASTIAKMIPKADTLAGLSEAAAAKLGVIVWDEIMARTEANRAYNNPWEQNLPPDKTPPAPATPAGDKPPSPQPEKDEGGNKGEFKPTTEDDMSAEKKEESKKDDAKDTGGSEKKEPDAPIPLSDNDVDIDDEIISTPVYDDFNTKTQIQKCQETIERELWKEIGGKTDDSNAEEQQRQREEQAAQLLALGMCDSSFYDRQTCQDFKNKQHSVPLPPDQAEDLKRWQLDHPICPENLGTESECHAAKQEILKRYAVTEGGEKALDILFQPGKPLPWLPKYVPPKPIPGVRVTGSGGPESDGEGDDGDFIQLPGSSTGGLGTHPVPNPPSRPLGGHLSPGGKIVIKPEPVGKPPLKSGFKLPNPLPSPFKPLPKLPVAPHAEL